MDSSTTPSPPPEVPPGAVESLVDRLVEEMTTSWDAGQRARAEDFLRRHPELYEHPQSAIRLVYEEVCLGQEHGEEVAEEVLRRFPQWRNELEIMLGCHALMNRAAPAQDLPQVGETLGEFRIMAELGRGGLGRVFLGSQPALANRPMVLKVTPCEGQEHLSLARLQHTHIVPLFWAEDFPERDLRLLCMPFLGTVTLDRLLHELAERPLAERTGADLVSILEKARAISPIVLPSQGPDRDRLQNASYVEAICTFGACLADALSYAHQRGLVHLDLKPSNILLATDGQPMILDFHLARTPVALGEAQPEWLGGTPDYMSPEQKTAVEAVSRGRPVPVRVDGQSDIYSLGLILYEALAGLATPGGRGDPRRLPRINPQVSIGLSDILARCLAAEPGERYPTAEALAADLRHHLNDQPLRGVPNRSVRERWQKWRRRQPHALFVIIALVLSVALVLVGYHVLITRQAEARAAAKVAAHLGRRQLLDKKPQDAQVTFRQGLEQARNLWWPDQQQIAAMERGLRSAARQVEEGKLQEFLSNLRYYAVVESLPRRLPEILVQGSMKLWSERQIFLEHDPGEIEPAAAATLRGDLLELVILAADARVRSAKPAELPQVRAEALQWLQEAEKQFGPSLVLSHEQLVHARPLGKADLVARLERDVAAGAPMPWEQAALGRFWLRQGDLDAADRALRLALKANPFDLLPHFYQGICAYRRHHFAEAIQELTFCIGRQPSAEAYFYRGMAHAAAGQPEQALTDYELALALSGPGVKGVVHLQRGLLHFEQKHYREAVADFTEAVPQGADPATAHYQRARALAALGDQATARAAVQEALRHRPDHPEALALQKQLAP